MIIITKMFHLNMQEIIQLKSIKQLSDGIH